MKYSIIIPTFNSASSLGQCLDSVKNAMPHEEIIVIDGGSRDLTGQIAGQYQARFKSVSRGRGIQLDYGARHASGQIYLFLHADSMLPKNAHQELERYFNNPENKVSTFILKFDRKHWLLDLYGIMSKVDSLWTSFGDQGIAIRKEFYEEIGGFPNWPLFEDVHLLQKARKETKIRFLNAELITSADRYVRNGYLNQQLKNGWLLLKYLKGSSPEKLAYYYEN